MFRLVKTLGGNVCNNLVTFYEKVNGAPIIGSVVTCTNNVATNTAADGTPDYVYKGLTISGKAHLLSQITNDMIFKVEYVSAMMPKIGMKVSIADYKGKSDAVTYNSSGKGVIVDVENKKMVYVRFQKS